MVAQGKGVEGLVRLMIRTVEWLHNKQDAATALTSRQLDRGCAPTAGRGIGFPLPVIFHKAADQIQPLPFVLCPACPLRTGTRCASSGCSIGSPITTCQYDQLQHSSWHCLLLASTQQQQRHCCKRCWATFLLLVAAAAAAVSYWRSRRGLCWLQVSAWIGRREKGWQLGCYETKSGTWLTGWLAGLGAGFETVALHSRPAGWHGGVSVFRRVETTYSPTNGSVSKAAVAGPTKWLHVVHDRCNSWHRCLPGRGSFVLLGLSVMIRRLSIP